MTTEETVLPGPDLITVKESEWDRVHAELARKDQAIEDIQAFVKEPFYAHSLGADWNEDPTDLFEALIGVQRILSGLSEHQEEAK